MTNTTLILGGGVGGLATAHALRRLLPPPHRIILVERDRQFVFAPSLLWLMTGDRTADQISRPYDRLSSRGIELVQGEIEAIDPARRTATVGGQRLQGDHMVIALGAELAPDAIPGLAAAGHNLYSLEGAIGLRDALGSLQGGQLAVLTAAPAYKCPAAPYEAALLLEYALHEHRVRDLTHVDLYTAEPGPMGVAGPAVSARVRHMVEARGIGYHPSRQVASVDPGGTLHFTEGPDARFDLLAYVPPHRTPMVVQAAGLTDATDWIPVDRHTMAASHPGVFAIGDVTTIPLSMGKPLPKAGVFAHAQAEVVARNIARTVTGQGDEARFDGHGACFLESGGGRAGFARGNFYAEPAPDIRLRRPGRISHLGKVLFERRALRTWV